MNILHKLTRFTATPAHSPSRFFRRNPLAALISTVMVFSLTPSNAHAITTTEAANGLAQGCFAIQSPGSGNYLARHQGLITSDLAFRFQKLDAANAEHFFVKPATAKRKLDSVYSCAQYTAV